MQVCSSVVSGYSGLGESASQISATPSHASSARGSSRLQPPGSCAGSTTSSAMMRIAALERELAVAKSESAQLRALVDHKGHAL